MNSKSSFAVCFAGAEEERRVRVWPEFVCVFCWRWWWCGVHYSNGCHCLALKTFYCKYSTVCVIFQCAIKTLFEMWYIVWKQFYNECNVIYCWNVGVKLNLLAPCKCNFATQNPLFYSLDIFRFTLFSAAFAYIKSVFHPDDAFY